MNLIETSCGIISSREMEEKVFRGRDHDRSLFLERRESLLSLFSFSSLCISIEALALVDLKMMTLPTSKLEVGHHDDEDDDDNLLLSVLGRRNQTCFVLTQELIRRIQGASVSTEKYRNKNSDNGNKKSITSEEDGEP